MKAWMFLWVLAIIGLVSGQMPPSGPLPDVAVEGLLATKLESAVNYMKVTVFVVNNGATSLNNIELIFDASNSSTSKTFVRYMVPSVAAGESKQVNTLWEVDKSMDLISAGIDPQNLIMESDEDNNRISFSLEADVPPDGGGPGPTPPGPSPSPGFSFDIFTGYEFIVMFLVVLMLVFLLLVYPAIKSRTSKPYYLLSAALYDEKKKAKSLYDLQRKLLTSKKSRIYTPKKEATEEFLVVVELKPADVKKAKSLSEKFGISQEFAENIVLAKRLKAQLLISHQQVYIDKLSKDLGIETKLMV
ncbi:MAG: hypothetical protein JXB14_07455 [Candidatus Altiarchaeota archaeon]|nr:hypothetical protein [Candidatus Altiarchaeota archaeon]